MRNKQSLCCLLCQEIHGKSFQVTKNLCKQATEKFQVKFLEDFYLDDLVDHHDPTIAAQFWTKVFVGLLDKHAPFRQRKGKNIYTP